jgi:hypothetical protein
MRQWFQLLNLLTLDYHKLVSTFAFNRNLRRYMMANGLAVTSDRRTLFVVDPPVSRIHGRAVQVDPRLTPARPRWVSDFQRLKLLYDESLSDCAFSVNLRRYTTCCGGVRARRGALSRSPRSRRCIPWTTSRCPPTTRLFTAAPSRSPSHTPRCVRQGLTLVHISAQPEPILVIEATASVHFPAQPEPFL